MKTFSFNATSRENAAARRLASKFDALSTIYWDYNLPLQIWPEWKAKGGNLDLERSWLLNYEPRLGRCNRISFAELVGKHAAFTQQDMKDFTVVVAAITQNLSKLMLKLGKSKDPESMVYYPN